MDIGKLGYAAAMYFSEDKQTIYFETSKGYLIKYGLPFVPKLLRSNLLRPKSIKVTFSITPNHLKVFLNPGLGAIKELNFRDISANFNLEPGSIFMRVVN